MISSCGLRLDLQTGFFCTRSFCCIYWISSALSSVTQHSVHLSIWLTACRDRGSQLFTARLFALAPRYTDIPDCEVKSMVSYMGLCQSQTVGQRHNHWSMSSPESSSACCECILFAALDTRSWRLREAAHWPSEVWRCLACGGKTSPWTKMLPDIIMPVCGNLCYFFFTLWQNFSNGSILYCCLECALYCFRYEKKSSWYKLIVTFLIL